MKAIILAAGKGTRMRPLTLKKPKPLVEVLGKPLLHHIFETLPDIIDEVILVTGYKGNMIKAYFGNKFLGKRINYLEQKEQTGPLPALHLGRPQLEGEENFFLLFADDLYAKADFEKLVKHTNAVLVHEVENPERFGIAVLDSEGKISEIEEKPEKPKSNLAITGAYVFSPGIFEHEPVPHPKSGEFFLPPVMQKLADTEGIYTEKAGLWIPIGYPEDLERAEEILKEKGGLY